MAREDLAGGDTVAKAKAKGSEGSTWEELRAAADAVANADTSVAADGAYLRARERLQRAAEAYAAQSCPGRPPK